MKALSIPAEWASDIFWDIKTVEVRTWKTDYRGQLLICASAHKSAMCISGHALCVVRLTDIVPFEPKHMEAAVMDTFVPNCWAWIFDHVEWIQPFPVKGKLHLYDVDEPIHYEAKNIRTLEKYYEPLVHWAGKDYHEPGAPYLNEEDSRAYWQELKDTLEH